MVASGRRDIPTARERQCARACWIRCRSRSSTGCGAPGGPWRSCSSTNGAIFANTVPRYPDIKADLELSNTALGSALGAYGAGALLLGLAASAVVARLGSARTATACVALAATNLVLLALAPSWALLALAFLLAGSLDSLADVAENVHGLRVERGSAGSS